MDAIGDLGKRDIVEVYVTYGTYAKSSCDVSVPPKRVTPCLSFSRGRLMATTASLSKNRGKELAAIISIDDFRLFERLLGLQEDRGDLEDARAALSEAESKGVKTLDRLAEELGL